MANARKLEETLATLKQIADPTAEAAIATLRQILRASTV